ncbi:hypothetical protein ACHAQH_004820 [Verticillium albo-atrum]
MRPLLPLLLCGILPAAQAFQFTGPDPSDKIDLSQPVEITWTLDSSFREPEARAFHLWFYAFIGDGESLAGWEIRSNLSLSSSSYTWDPISIVDGLVSEHNTVLPDKVHYFEARLVGADGRKLARLESEKYALEGYDFIRNGGGRVGVEPAAVGVMAGIAIVGGVLL